jgi:hypothetical protein
MKDETLESIGKLLTKPMSRDAVHIAVVRVTAGPVEVLKPGQHVHLGGNFTAVSYANGEPAGIVDPYLTDEVTEGQSFWLFLYPGTITSLKHVWTHPDIPDIKQAHPSGMTFAEAEHHLRTCAENWDVTEFADLLDAISHHTMTGVPTVSISVQDWTDLSPEEYKKFWDCAEVFLGERFNQEHRDGTYFACCA